LEIIKILTILGARPQFVKAAIVTKAIEAHNREHSDLKINELLLHTGQHYDHEMSAVFFEELDIKEPSFNLGIGSASHGAQTGRMMEAIEKVIVSEMPDWVLIYGDTNSTLAAALAAVKLHIPLAHVEAGLRSFDRKLPEEVNRIVADHMADLLFAPTDEAVKNLNNEGFSDDRVLLTGDVMYDAALYFGEKALHVSRILSDLQLDSGGYVLCTLHRAENTNNRQRLTAILDGLSLGFGDVPLVLPIHPRTRKTLSELGLLESVKKKFQLIEPVGYLDMIMLEKNARLIATDSGGVQKEAFFHRVPCLTLLDRTP